MSAGAPSQRMYLSLVAAPNGLGHISRLLGLATELARRDALAQLSIIAAPWQREALRAHTNRLDTGPGTPGVPIHWHTKVFDEAGTNLFELTDLDDLSARWARRLQEHSALAEASVVLSDNLALVLSARPDTLLVGSFLWQDVLAEGEFTQREAYLLEQYRPRMICNAWLATDRVLTQTIPQPVSWTAARDPAAPTPAVPPMVEVNVGASGLMLEEGANLVRRLAARGIHLQVTPALWQALDSPERTMARIREDRPTLAILRPGVQSVSEYVAAGVPMLLMYESNPEMVHNARTLTRLGLATDICEHGLDGRADAVEAFLCAADLGSARARLLAQPSIGLSQMATIVQSHVSTAKTGRQQ